MKTSFTFDRDEFAVFLFDRLGSTDLTDDGDEDNVTDFFLQDCTVMDILDCIDDYIEYQEQRKKSLTTSTV